MWLLRYPKLNWPSNRPPPSATAWSRLTRTSCECRSDAAGVFGGGRRQAEARCTPCPTPMTEGDLAVLMREAMWVSLRLGGPPLAVALAVGLLVSLLQAITQVNEATLAFVPKALALAV